MESLGVGGLLMMTAATDRSRAGGEQRQSPPPVLLRVPGSRRILPPVPAVPRCPTHTVIINVHGDFAAQNSALRIHGAQVSRVPDSAQVPFDVDIVAACWWTPGGCAPRTAAIVAPGVRVGSWCGQFFVEFFYLSGHGVGVVFISE